MLRGCGDTRGLLSAYEPTLARHEPLLAVEGLVWGFGALWFRSGLSLAWRWLGQPMWINSDFVNGILFASFMAGLMHSAARGALKDGRIPTTRWIRIGVICGMVVVAGMLLLHVSDIQEQWHRYSTQNDTAPTRSSLVQPL